MVEQAKSILGIMIIIYIVIPIINTYTNSMSQLDGHVTSGSHLDVCCDAANVGFIGLSCDELIALIFKILPHPLISNTFLLKSTQVIGFTRWERNISGHTVSKSGISFEMLDWLSYSMKFEYVQNILVQKSIIFTFL